MTEKLISVEYNGSPPRFFPGLLPLTFSILIGVPVRAAKQTASRTTWPPPSPVRPSNLSDLEDGCVAGGCIPFLDETLAMMTLQLDVWRCCLWCCFQVDVASLNPIHLTMFRCQSIEACAIRKGQDALKRLHV